MNRKLAIVIALLAVFLLAAGQALAETTISLEPANAQREVGGKVRVHIYVNDAANLLSMGVKVTFNPAVLQVVEAHKFEKDADGNIVWLMDADGDPATTDDQYNNPAVEIDNTSGTVTMIGGHLTGSSTAGLNGKILLGWIVFEAIANGTSNLHVDLAKYGHDGPSNKTFDNFVNVDKTVDEPTNVPGDLGVICVIANACEGDVNSDGVVNAGDTFLFRKALPSQFGGDNYSPCLDMNGDGVINAGDTFIFRHDLPRNDCPACP